MLRYAAHGVCAGNVEQNRLTAVTWLFDSP
jgi:hypothetical protein